MTNERYFELQYKYTNLQKAFDETLEMNRKFGNENEKLKQQIEKLKEGKQYETCPYRVRCVCCRCKGNQPTVEEMLKRLVKGGYVKSGIYEKKEKVIWHDLRKNPKDLPPKDVGTFSTFVITNKGIGYYVDCQNKWFVYWNVTGSYECSTEVVAWCELPKFEVEE